MDDESMETTPDNEAAEGESVDNTYKPVTRFPIIGKMGKTVEQHTRHVMKKHNMHGSQPMIKRGKC